MLDCVFGFGCPGLFLRMFVRRKKNRSGVISIQIIDKSTGNYKVVKTIGNSSDPSIIEILVKEGEEWISKRKGELFFDFQNEHQLLHPLQMVSNRYMLVVQSNCLESCMKRLGFIQLMMIC